MLGTMPEVVRRQRWAPVLYPDMYAWLVLLSALDIMLTHSILFHFADFGGREVNTIADWVIRRFDIAGAIALKFLSVTLVVLVCEYVGRRRPRTGRGLISVILVLAAFPPAWALLQLLLFTLAPAQG
jgi:hypothetical protein